MTNHWQKKGLIYVPDGQSDWAKHTVITPTPFLLTNDTIRIYAGFRDDQGVSRIGYIDVLADNPKKVLKVSQTPVLDIGRPGTFDDNGIILGDVVRYGDSLRMYYVGFQIVQKAKFLAYSGLAISEDGGETFQRYQDTPIMDRTSNALYIRAIHSVIREREKWRIWYSVGSGWQKINGIDYPQYYIRYTESEDGINFPDAVGIECINVKNNEYRIGRPRVRKTGSVYEMRYTYDTLKKEYRCGYAESEDGVHWTRKDQLAALDVSNEGWDSEMVCYPVVFEANHRTYMIYSGNGMGRTGVGYAELENGV